MKQPPEEKLLRLIRGKAARIPSEAVAVDPASGGAAVAAARAVWTRPAAASWSVAAVWGLGAIVAVEALLLILSVAWPVARPVVPAVPPPVDPVAVDPSGVTVPALAEIPSLAAVSTRPVFGASSGGTDGSVGPVATTQSGSARMLVTRLTLMGIVSGNPPQAIIQDSQTQKTYFVSAGQAVAEGALLEQILDNRVVLNYMGEKFELNL